MMKFKIEGIEDIISTFLRGGVLICALIIGIGQILMMKEGVAGLDFFTDYQQATLLEQVQVAWQLNQWGIPLTFLGIAALICLPIIRVFLTGLLFLSQKQFMMATLAGFVLVCLLFSILLGK